MRVTSGIILLLAFVTSSNKSLNNAENYQGSSSGDVRHVRYEILTSGECTDVGSYIETVEECRAAAASVDWPVDDRFLVASRGDWPAGCWLNYVGNKARFNTMSDSTEPCQDIDRCLCKVEYQDPSIFSATSEDECIHEIFDIGRVFGKEAHTIHVKLDMPEYSEPRQWILNLGQETTGANHWIWRGETVQFGSWNGSQIRKVHINSCTDLTTTFDGNKTLTLYCNGKFLGQIENSNLNIQNSNLAVAGNQRYEVPRGNFGGCVHFVEVWDYDLSPRDVASLTKNAPEERSVGY